MIPAYQIWLGVTILFGVVEAATLGLTSVWFAVGALAAMVCALLGGQVWLQILLFVVVSVLALIFIGKKVRGKFNVTRQPTNADRILGQTGIVTEAIDNTLATGAVKVDGKVWTARSTQGRPIPAGTEVIVRTIEGVKVLVEPA